MDAANTKFLTTDNSEATATNKQHGFKPVASETKYTFDNYIGNKSLCGKLNITEDGENSLPFSELPETEIIDADGCKTCFKIYSKAISELL